MRNSNSKRMPRRRQSAQTTFGLAAFIAVLVVGFFVYPWLRLDLYWIWLLVVNAVTFVFYRFDKRQALVGATRVPEIILLALLAVGGVLGGAAGMFMRPRHKTQKPLFWIVLLVATAIHGYLLYRWMLS